MIPERRLATLAELQVPDGQMTIEEAIRDQTEVEEYTRNPETVNGTTNPQEIGQIALLENMDH